MNINEYKAKAKELGISNDTVRTFGTLREKASWELAVAAKENEIQAELAQAIEAKQEFEQTTKSVKTYHEPCLNALDGLESQEEIQKVVYDYVTGLKARANSDSTFAGACSELIKQINAKFPNPSETLQKVYGKYSNFCAVTFVYEIQNTFKLGSQHVKTETAVDEVVTLDFEKIVNQLEADLVSDDWVILGTAIAGLTGRRPSEVFCLSKFEVIDDCHVKVSNLAKKRGNDAEEKLEYIFPTLAHADDILAAVEKLRTLKPFLDVIEKAQSEGNSAARDHFSDIHCGGDGLRKQFKEKRGFLFADCVKDSFGATRNFYASSILWLYKKVTNCSIPDAIKKAKDCVAHDSSDTTLRYASIEFTNLPTKEKDFFRTETVVVQDKIVDFNLTEFHEIATPEQSLDFKRFYEKFNGNLAQVMFAMSKREKPEIQQQRQTKIMPETASDRIEKMIKATIKHNKNLTDNDKKLENKKYYVYVTKGFLDNMCFAIFGKRQAPKTLTEMIERHQNEIDDSNKWNCQGTVEELKNRRSNLHLRGKKGNNDKMDKVIAFIKNEYLQMQDM